MNYTSFPASYGSAPNISAYDLLTEEAEQDTYAATMEQSNATLENLLFDSVSSTQYAKPAGFDTDTSNHYVSWLNPSASGGR